MDQNCFFSRRVPVRNLIVVMMGVVLGGGALCGAPRGPYQVPMLSPAESMNTMRLAEGFRVELAEGFRVCWPIDDVPDVHGGRGRVREDNTLNWFTGVAGQSIYRGDRLPDDFYGDLLIPEPVGRLIRRAKVRNVAGKIVLSNAYDKKEFLASTDPNFRPVNSATGPDGCLYIVDIAPDPAGFGRIAPGLSSGL